jgi:hypothetical protein
MKRAMAICIVAAASIGFWSCDKTGPSGAAGVSGEISTAVTWTADTYVSGDLNVTDTGSLTVNPGVTVTVASGATISIAPSGVFKAVGSSDHLITFKNAVTGSGWDGFLLSEGSDNNTFTYCDISGASGGADCAAIKSSHAGNGAKAAISYCDIHDNDSVGVDAWISLSGTSITNTRFYGNSSFPIVMGHNVAADKSNAFGASGQAAVQSSANCVYYKGDIGTSETRELDIVEIPYLLEGPIVYGILTIDKGATICLPDHGVMTVADTGSVVAEGDAVNPIAFKPWRITDRWDQIYFSDASDGNSFAYCDIYGAGGNDKYAIETYWSGTGVELDLDDCRIYGNAHGGVFACVGDLLTENCSFGNNGDSASGPYDVYYDNSSAPRALASCAAIASTNAFTTHSYY